MMALLLVAFVLLLLLLFKSFIILCFKFHRKCRKLANLPQIKGNLLLGNLELFAGNLFKLEKDTLYERCLNALNKLMNDYRDGGVFLIWVSIAPHLLLTNASAVECLLSNQKIIEKSLEYDMFKLWLGTGLLTSSGEKWRSRRKFLTPSFHFRILNDFIPTMNKHFRFLVEKIRKQIGKPIDVVDYMQLATLDVICETAMGVCINAQSRPDSKYVNCVTSCADLMFNRFFEVANWFDCIYYRTEGGRNYLKSIRFMHQFTYDVINTRKKLILEERENQKQLECDNNEDIHLTKKSKNTAFMDLLIRRHLDETKEDGASSFTLEDIREEVDTFLFEGFDTTSAALTWTLHLLGNNPLVQEKAYEEVVSILGDDMDMQLTEHNLREFKYIECCIKEALRLYPSVPLFGRKTTERINICGYLIPSNVTVGVFAYGLHRDPKVFPEPEEYIPERFLPENCLNRHPFAYIPFSAGPRNCIGQKFAMMELKIAVVEILRHFKLESLKKKISISVNVIIKAKEPVSIIFTPRSPELHSF